MKNAIKSICIIMVILVNLLILNMFLLNTQVEAATPTVSYNSHIQDIGWETDFSKSNGQLSGTSGKKLRLEAMKIKLSNMPSGVSIKYQTHIENIGWQGWKQDGQLSGTSGQSLRLEGIRIKLEGTKEYRIEYRVHVENIGWQDWKNDGDFAGTEGQKLRLEAIEIRLVKISNPIVEYNSHIQMIGWERDFLRSNGTMSGTTGKNYGLQALKIRLKGVPNSANIIYQTHVQNIGWQSWVNEGNMAGTTGRDLNIEAIKIKLNNLPGKSIEYRVHVQNIGWQEWKKDGELAGTTGKELRVEAIQIRIINKVLPDTTKPVITLKGANPQIINVGSSYTELGASVTDNIDKNLTPIINWSAVNTNKVGTYLVKYNATDKSGNKANEVARTVKVVDTVKPVITLASTNVYEMPVKGVKPIFKATAIDNYDGSIKLTITDNINVNVVGKYTVTFTAKDSSGNTTIINKDFIVKDTIKPVITLSNENKYEMEAKTVKPIFKATAMDNNDGNINVTITDNININVVGKYTVTFTAKDSSQNTTIVTKDFIVKDTTKPVITLSNTNIYEMEVKGQKPNLRATAIDNYDGNITVNVTENINVNVIGKYTVTFTAKDSSGNTTIVTKDFIVKDTTKPIIKLDNTNIYRMEVNEVKPTFTATVSDNYDADVEVVITDDIDINTVGKYTVTFTATDSSNNIQTMTKEFIVEDTIKPTITIDDTNIYEMEVNGVKPTFKAIVSDNYDKNVNVIITDNIDINIVGKYIVTFTAIDSSNNTQVITKEFNVKSKELVDINITVDETVGYANENINLGVIASGLNQKELTLEELKFYITDKDGNEILDSNIIQIDGNYYPGNVIEKGIILTVNAKQKGIYKITPYVGTNINDPKVIKIDTPVEIDVTNNPIVTLISVDEILDKELMLNKSVDKKVTFKNKYNEEISVAANRIKINLVDGVNIKLLDKYGDIIDETRPTEDVASIRFSTTLTDKVTKNISIKVDDITQIINVNISESSKITNIVIDENITLYGQMPTTPENNVMQGENGEIYTIMPIEIQNQNQEKIDLFGNMSIEKTTGEKLEVIDSIYNPDDLLDTPRIITQMYKKVGEKYEIAADTDKADYIGIALADEESIKEMNGGKVLLKVGGKMLAEINVTIPIMKLNSIEIQKGNTKGKINEDIQIGVVKSGVNQENLTKEQLKYYITDKNGNVITDSSIISATGNYGPGNVIEDGVIITVNATKSGIYKITPYIGISINDPDVIKISNPVEVSIDIDLIVKTIEISDVSISKGNVVDKTIIFKNKDSEQINVPANKLTIDKTLAEGIIVTLLDKAGDIIGLDRPNEDVGGIRFETTLESQITKSLSITVDGITKTLNINVAGKPKLTTIEIDSNINLYETEPTTTTETIKIENSVDGDIIYTLKEIKLKDQKGNLIKLFADYSIETDSTNKLVIKDSLTPVGDPLPYIEVKLYKDYNGEIVEALGLDEVKYIGISLAEGTLLSDLAGKTVQIMYNGVILTEINII